MIVYDKDGMTTTGMNDGDSAFVRRGVLVTEQFYDYAIGGYATGLSAVIQGDVVGAYAGISLGGIVDGSVMKDQKVNIASDASVSGFGRGWGGVSIVGYHSNIQNAGDIWGDFYGIYFDTTASSKTYSVIANSGDATGGTYGIYALGSERLVITNTGRIYGAAFSFGEHAGNGVQEITNKGEMDGNIALGGGNDLYDGRKGLLDGYINGGAGNDRIYGGSENDTIYGGAGNDILSGGAGSDVFIFNSKLSKTTNVDTILDFGHAADTFELSHAVFAGLKAGGLASAAFKQIASATSTAGVDASDRILYDKAHGDLYFDQDGSGTRYGRVLFAHVADGLALNSTDFHIV